jgi:hypothetical protein
MTNEKYSDKFEEIKDFIEKHILFLQTIVEINSVYVDQDLELEIELDEIEALEQNEEHFGYFCNHPDCKEKGYMSKIGTIEEEVFTHIQQKHLTKN